jgi:GHH signature containing HNH/Endo VII superfamily nuclease toxin
LIKDAAEQAALQLARQRGVDRAWALERKLIQAGAETTQAWTKAEREAIKAGKTPAGWIAHHINNVADHSIEMAEDPSNIEFVRGRAAHLEKHNGSWFNGQ